MPAGPTSRILESRRAQEGTMEQHRSPSTTTPQARGAANTPVVGLVGVYHADGGPIGEAKYVVGKLLGTAHCGLCDVTHSPVRRKPAWDAMVARLGVAVDLLHLNELPRDVAAQVRAHGSPLVLGRTLDGALHVLLEARQLDALGGSVPRFEAALRGAVGRSGAVLQAR
jgi:hypothetical protein